MLLTYKSDPSPIIVDVISAFRYDVLIYPAVPRPAIVLVKDCVLTYPRVPRPWREDVLALSSAVKLLRYPKVPRPSMVDWRLRLLMYPDVPSPFTVDGRAEAPVSCCSMEATVDTKLWVLIYPTFMVKLLLIRAMGPAFPPIHPRFPKWAIQS